MNLLRIKINSNFSSLSEGFCLNFRSPFDKNTSTNESWAQFHPFCFAGLNGSGKSNVLEALSNIFYHLESCANVNQPENFKDQFNPKKSKPDAYELEYYIKPQIEDAEYHIENMVLVNIIKEAYGEPEMTWKPYPFINEQPRKVDIITPKNAKNTAAGKVYLPDLIIGYSSGENETLSIPFLKSRLLHFDEYKEAIRKKLKYKNPESNLIYIDYEMSQAVLLSNYLFQDKETVLEPLETELGILDIKRFRMNLNIGHLLEKQGILTQFEDTIAKFKRCSSAHFQNDDKLLLDFWINEDTKKAIQENFSGGVFELFQAFQVLYTLNYHSVDLSTKSDVYGSKGYYTQGKVHSPGPKDKVFYFLDYYIEKCIKGTNEIKELLLKQLSDGEQQFIHSLGICLMLKNKCALLLLDEPETHFNPDWRSKFISTLKKSLVAAGSNNMQNDILITSHSPFIISDCFPDKVVVFERNNTGKVEAISAHDNRFNTFGSSVSIVMEEIFKKDETISDYSHQILKEIENRTFNSPEDIEQAKKDSIILGESVEKVLLFRKLLLKEKELKDKGNA